MLRRCATWCVAIPLMLAGTEAAHALAYRIAYPQLHLRLQMLADAGHGYTGQIPLALGVAGAVATCALAWFAVDEIRGGAPQPLPALAFAVLPLLGFVLQELVERWLAVGSAPWWMVLQPTFRIGLALQLPFGIAAYLAARLLLRVSRHVGRIARRPPPPRTTARRPAPPRPPCPALPALPIVLLALSGRGPPLPAR